MLPLAPLLQHQAVPPTSNQGTHQTILSLGNISVETLRTFLTQLEGGNNAIAGAAPSHFSHAIRISPIPPSFRGVRDLRFTEITEPLSTWEGLTQRRSYTRWKTLPNVGCWHQP